MICKLRLNKRRDLDLLWLYYNDKDFYKQIIVILDNYAKGETPTYTIKNLNPVESRIELKSNPRKSSNVYLNLSIKDTYTDIINMLSHIKDKHKCDFIKNLIKWSLPYPILQGYFIDGFNVDISNMKKSINIDENISKPDLLKTDKVDETESIEIIDNNKGDYSTLETNEEKKEQNDSFEVFNNLMQNYM